MADIIGRRYGLSPFSSEVQKIMDNPVQLAVIKELMKQYKTTGELCIDKDVELFKLLQKEMYNVVDVAMTYYRNYNRPKGASLIKSIFKKKQESQPILFAGQKVIIEPNF